MNVTELREKLQALEAQGHGKADVIYVSEWKGRLTIEEPQDPRLEVVSKQLADKIYPEGSTVVEI